MRAVFYAGVVVVAATVLVGAGRLWAEGKEKKPAKPEAPRTRIALINLTYVIKNYEKYIKFQKEIQEIIKPFQDTDAKFRKEIEELGKVSPPPDKTEEVEREMKELKRKQQNNSDEAKLVLGKKSDEQMKELYTDVCETAQHFATKHDFDLVLHFNDAVTDQDLSSPMNIARKVQTGALMPLYATPGMDISKEIVEILNDNKRAAP